MKRMKNSRFLLNVKSWKTDLLYESGFFLFFYDNNYLFNWVWVQYT